MKRLKLLLIIVLISLAAYAGYFLSQQGTGYVLLSYQDWSIETSVLVFGTLIIILFVLFYFSLRFVFNLFRVPDFISQSYHAFQDKKSTSSLVKGLTEIAEGRFKKAENILVKQAGQSKTSVLNYLMAARAAQLQHADERRDDYLKRAHEQNPDAVIAIGLTQAELQLAHQQNEMALATLNHLHQESPRHEYVMRLMSRAYLQLEDWEHLCPLLADIRQIKSMPEKEMVAIEIKAYSGHLTSAGKQQNSELLISIWHGMPKHLKTNQQMVLLYARQLVHNHLLVEAEQLLRESIKKKWSDELIAFYSQFIGEEANGHTKDDSYYKGLLTNCETWLKQYPHHAALLLISGKLCMRLKLWGKARGYFEASLGINPMPETYQQMAILLEQLNEKEKAQQYYRLGLNFALSKKYSV